MDLAAKKCFAAVDIGASSGRVLLGWLDGGKMRLEEVHRFVNGQRRVNGHDCWDVEALADEVIAGLRACNATAGATPLSVSIDTWGCDFVLLDGEGKLVGDAVAYRDARTQGVPELVDIAVPSQELYRRTGIQRQSFNTIYQLVALGQEHPDQLARAERLLTIPDYLNWRLTGVAANEYTNASTTGLLDAASCDWDRELMSRLGIPTGLVEKPVMPGVVLGRLTPEVAEKVGYQADVTLVASHDTGSAFLAVPARDESSVFISSGTWSLVGVELPEPVTTEGSRRANFTNEGGYQRRYRYLKNVMGLWMSQSVRRELNGVDYVEGKTSNTAKADHEVGFGELIDAARAAGAFAAVVDVDDPRFLAPASMIGEIRAACADAGQPVPETTGEVMRTIYCSLVADYHRAVEKLSSLTGRRFTSINIVGGGSQDAYLDELTAAACGLPVFAGPTEGTCLGNLMVQMIATGDLADVQAGRDCIARSFDVKRYEG